MKLSPQRLDGLTGLRAIAALWVVAFHYRLGPFHPLGASHVLPILGFGYLGVDLFFILSGFVIWHVHGAELGKPGPRKLARFMCLRGARLYPVYLVTLALFALLLWLGPRLGDPPLNPANFTDRQLLFDLPLLQSWGFTNHLNWNYPAWSVSAEWFCYLFFPMAAVAAARAGRWGTAAGAALLMAIVCATYVTLFQHTLNQAVGMLALLRALPEFLLGCLLRQLFAQFRMEKWPWTAIVGSALLAWIVSFWTILPVGLLAIPLFTSLILAGATTGCTISRVLSARPLVMVGAASYSLYLMQAPVGKGAGVLKQYLSRAHPAESIAIVIAYLILLALGTALMHVLVENPARRALRARIDSWLPPSRASSSNAASVGHAVVRAS